MIYISDSDVSGHLSFDEAEHAIAQGFAALAAGRAEIHARHRSASGGFRLATMGASWPDCGFALTKCYSAIEGRFDFMCTLFDTATGQVLCSMEANELTKFRTAALSVMAISNAALRTRKVALFGAGVQGAAHVEAVTARYDVEEISVVDTRDVADWCARLSDRSGVPIFQTSSEDAVAGADVIITTTRSKTPVFEGALLEPGALIVAVGTSTAGGTELDGTTLGRAARVVVEWLPQSMEEAGEVVWGLHNGALSPNRIVSIPELIAARSQWRQANDEIIVFKAVGVGLADLAAAIQVWKSWTCEIS